MGADWHAQGEISRRCCLVCCKLALSSLHRFNPPGLITTSCDRITSSTVCHNETFTTPHEKDPDASLIGECVLDNYGVEEEDKCSDGCCCFTKSKGKEKCRAYQLDNYTLTALVESGDEEYQHFQNATGHWVRRHGQSALRS